MNSSLAFLRTKFHPLHTLRNYTVGRWILRHLDFPIWIQLHGIPYSIRINAFRNASYIGGAELIEQDVRSVVDLISAVYPVKLFWDIGANIGFYSYYLKTKLPDLSVVAYEPDPGNLSNLNATIKKHSLEWLQVSSKAVSDHVGETRFHIDALASVTGSLVDAEGVISKKLHGVVHDESLRVETTTLDSELRLCSPDLVKIDVEGAELMALHGGPKLFSTVPPILIIEAKQDNLRDVMLFLSESYGSLYCIGNPNQSHPNLLALPERFGPLNETFLGMTSKCNLTILSLP